MKIFGIDTATSGCSAALLRDGTVAAAQSRPMLHGHAEALMPMVLAVMAAARADFAGLDAVAVTVGPGSFTGLRVGLATARGLALAHDLPVIGLTTLEVVAFGARSDAAAARGPATIVAAVETRRADVYVQFFSPALDPLSPPAASAPADIGALAPAGPLVIAGDAAARVADTLRGRPGGVRVLERPAAADAVLVARLADERTARAGLPGRSDLPAPLYVHPPQATVPLNQGRLRP